MAFPVDNIRELCRQNNTTLAQLERKLGYGNGVIAGWQGAKTYPPHDRLLAIAKELGVTVSDLTGEEKEPAIQTDDGNAQMREIMSEKLRNMPEARFDKIKPALEILFGE